MLYISLSWCFLFPFPDPSYFPYPDTWYFPSLMLPISVPWCFLFPHPDASHFPSLILLIFPTLILLIFPNLMLHISLPWSFLFSQPWYFLFPLPWCFLFPPLLPISLPWCFLSPSPCCLFPYPDTSYPRPPAMIELRFMVSVEKAILFPLCCKHVLQGHAAAAVDSYSQFSLAKHTSVAAAGPLYPDSNLDRNITLVTSVHGVPLRDAHHRINVPIIFNSLYHKTGFFRCNKKL